MVRETAEVARQRDPRMFVWLADAGRDAGYALRVLRRNPVMALTAALSLAIGIGANTAIFTVANALLFRAPAGVAEPDRLVDIGVERTGRGAPPPGNFNPTSYPMYLDIRSRATLLAGVYAKPMFPEALSLSVASDAGGVSAGSERVFGQFVTTNYFDVLGARPALGRLLSAADSEQPGASPIVALSHRFWMHRFNGDPSVVGRTIRLNGQPLTIIGVTAEDFQGTGVLAGDVWLPLTMMATLRSQSAAIFEDRRSNWLLIGARLKPGVTQEAAATEIQAIGHALRREFPDQASARAGARDAANVVMAKSVSFEHSEPLSSRDLNQAAELRLIASSAVPGNRGTVAAFMALLMALVSLVLLVACANVSGLLLARAAARRREMAVRLALGAGRARVVRQLLMETIILFLIGGTAGIALARVMTTMVVAWLPRLPFPISVQMALDARVVAFTVGLSLIAALIFGLAPARQASKADPVTALKDDSQGPSGRAVLRHLFVITQIAFSLVLIVIAGLFVRALVRAGTLDPGFDPHGVELASIDLSMANYTDTTGARFAHDLITRVRQLPDVQSATLARVLPGGFESMRLSAITVPGLLLPNGQRFLSPDWNIIEPGYFARLRMPLVAGRDFTDRDLPGMTPVAIIEETLARQLWPGQDAIGKLLTLSSAIGLAPNATKTVQVVGVARDARTSSMVDGLSRGFIYVPLQQVGTSRVRSMITIVARSTHGQRIADSLRVLVSSMNPNLPIAGSETLEDSVALGFVSQRVVASISGSLGLVGLLLAAIGIYGVTAFAVACRSREFGIRLALGATRGDILRLVLRQGAWLMAIGCAIGLTVGAGAGKILTGFLFGLPPLDPVTFIGAAALFAAIGLAASYGPARRATSVDPLTTLRHE